MRILKSIFVLAVGPILGVAAGILIFAGTILLSADILFHGDDLK